MTLEEFKVSADFKWDLANKKIYEDVTVNSGDVNGRKMRVQVVDGKLIRDLTGYTLNLGWKNLKDPTAKGLDAFKVVDITKGIFEIPYTTAMLSNVGRLIAALQLVGIDDVVESNNFLITVRNSNIDADAIQTESSFTALTEALVTVNQLNAEFDDAMLGWGTEFDDTLAGWTSTLSTTNDTFAQMSADAEAAYIEQSAGFNATFDGALAEWDQTVDTKVDEYEVIASNLESTYAPELNSLKTQLEQTQAQFNQAVGAVTEYSEVVLARNEHPTLKERLDAELDNVNAHMADKVQVGNRVVLGEEEFELVKILEHQSMNSYTIDVGDGFVVQGAKSEGFSKYDYNLNRLWVYFHQSNNLGLGFGSDSQGNIYIPTELGIEVINNLGVHQKTINQGVMCRCLNIDKANNVIYHDYNGAFRKSDLDGNLIWEDTTRDGFPRAIELLNNGKIVTGRYSITNSTICYNSDGTVYWVSNNPYRVIGITSDDESNVYVIGHNTQLAKLRYNNGNMVWTNTFIVGYYERSQISKDNSGNVYVSKFSTGYDSFFAKVDMGSGNIITQNSFGTRHNIIKFINRNLIIVSRIISSGGDYMTAVYRLKNDVVEVL